MKLLTSELRQFKSNAAFIKANNILPILSFLKVQPGSITKNNLNSFLVQNISYSGQPFLIEERILMTMVDNTSAEEITVAVGDGKVTISDGTTKTTSDSLPLAEFPSNAIPDTDPIAFSGELLDQIFIASRFVEDEADNIVKTCVFISPDAVRSSNGFIAYEMKMATNCPNIFIPRTTTVAIAKLQAVSFSENASYQFFTTDKYQYGFVKAEYKFIDMSSFFQLGEVPTFTIAKDGLIYFNNQAIANAVSKVAATIMSVKPGEVSLTMKDNSYNVDTSSVLTVDGGRDGELKYNPVLLNRLLKAMQGDVLTVHQASGKYYFTSEDGSMSLIMEIN